MVVVHRKVLQFSIQAPCFESTHLCLGHLISHFQKSRQICLRHLPRFSPLLPLVRLQHAQRKEQAVRFFPFVFLWQAFPRNRQGLLLNRDGTSQEWPSQEAAGAYHIMSHMWHLRTDFILVISNLNLIYIGSQIFRSGKFRLRMQHLGLATSDPRS
jgi:hypothetical protein